MGYRPEFNGHMLLHPSTKTDYTVGWKITGQVNPLTPTVAILIQI